MEEALQEVVAGTLSIRAAATKYNIAYGTLYNKYKGKHINKVGGQTIFSKHEELIILESAAKCADWGFPLTLTDIRMFAKSYLDKKGRNVKKFNNNLPGKDWAFTLLNRHNNLYGQRLATNIKQSRASVSKETLLKYFTNLENVLKDVPPENIFNYDESNVSDDPGKKYSVYRRGVKYPEKVCNHSKSATSIMICGSANGTMLPPYIIYKSIYLYDTWKENGPVGKPCCEQPCCSRGARFNRTISGWIDAVTFRDWFISTFLPHAKRLQGQKVLIGDNLSSHFDEDILKMCRENEIDFVCLVPNSTHICQPLDVGFFRPMKTAWRYVLTEWKSQNLKISAIPKDRFPSLLRKCLERMDVVKVNVNKQNEHLPGNKEVSSIKRNLINSFYATGIYPINKNEVLKKLPQEENINDIRNEMENSLTDFLRERRYGNNENGSARKKKRLRIEPGASLSTLPSDNFQDIPDAEETECSPDNIEEEEDEESHSVPEPGELSVNDFILVEFNYNNHCKKTTLKSFVAQILEIKKKGCIIKCMRHYLQKNDTFVFPQANDINEISFEKIKLKLSAPNINRGRYIFKAIPAMN